MVGSLLKRALLIPVAVVLLSSGCSTTPGRVDDSHLQDTDTLYALAREAYQTGDHFLAAERLIVLARHGDSRGQYALGYLYYRGQGVLRDQARALELFRLSAAQGNAKAIKALELLEGRSEAGSQSAPQPQANRVVVEPPPPPEVAQPATESAADSAQVKPVVQISPASEAVASEDVSRVEQAAAPEPTASDVPFSASWLRHQDATQFTIQLVGSSTRQGLDELVMRFDLAERAGVVETIGRGERWYIVLYGLYADMEQARTALRALPNELRRDQPWIRSIEDVLAQLPAS